MEYEVTGVEVRGCLHLKSAATLVGEHLLLINPEWVDRGSFVGMEFVEAAPGEAGAANGLLVHGSVLYAAHFPRTRERLERRGVKVVPVEGDRIGQGGGGDDVLQHHRAGD